MPAQIQLAGERHVDLHRGESGGVRRDGLDAALHVGPEVAARQGPIECRSGIADCENCETGSAIFGNDTDNPSGANMPV